jgi:hypothetical protein
MHGIVDQEIEARRALASDDFSCDALNPGELALAG